MSSGVMNCTGNLSFSMILLLLLLLLYGPGVGVDCTLAANMASVEARVLSYRAGTSSGSTMNGRTG